jgi:ABC-2 type transport system permease protein
MLLPQIVTLGIIGVCLFPVSLSFFNWAVRKGKKDGTLMQY